MSEPTGTGQVPQEGGRQFGMALAAGLFVALVVAGIAYLWVRTTNSDTPTHMAALPMGAAEQAYVGQITFTDVEMSRAENFLHQQVTYINGVVSNNGPRSITALEVTLEFHDIPQKVVMREPQRIFSAQGASLAAGTKRQFQLSFETIPDDWDRRPPTFIVTGLQLQ